MESWAVEQSRMSCTTAGCEVYNGMRLVSYRDPMREGSYGRFVQSSKRSCLGVLGRQAAKVCKLVAEL